MTISEDFESDIESESDFEDRYAAVSIVHLSELHSLLTIMPCDSVVLEVT